MTTQHLTNSRYVAGLQCFRRLWLSVHEPVPYQAPLVGSPQQTGQEIGRKACALFPGGEWVTEEAWQHQEAITRTVELMRNSDVPAIFDAAFEYESICIRADVLERHPEGSWACSE
jgi:hypothetical protein